MHVIRKYCIKTRATENIDKTSLFSEDLLSESLLDAREPVGAHGHAHAEGRAHQLAHGRQLPRVKMDSN